MSSTLYKDIRAFRALLSHPISNTSVGDLLGQHEYWLITAKTAESNCYPHHFHETILFVGDNYAIQQFITANIYFFDDGLSQLADNRHSNGKSFERLLNVAMKEAEVWTSNTLTELNFCQCLFPLSLCDDEYLPLGALVQSSDGEPYLLLNRLAGDAYIHILTLVDAIRTHKASKLKGYWSAQPMFHHFNSWLIRLYTPIQHAA
jgi:hypothetical protein